MSICFLSLESNKIFNNLILENLIKEGFDGLSEALIVLFPYIEYSEKITTSQLSKKLGYSRQAIHKHIKKLEDFSYITLSFTNQKEKVIKLTSKGNKLMISANNFISNIEDQLSTLIGNDELEIYKQNQNKIYQHLLSIN